MPTATMTNAAGAPVTVEEPLLHPGTTDARPAAANRSEDVLNALWLEIKGYHERINGFPTEEPDQVLLAISGISARVSEIRAHLFRSQQRQAASFRSNLVEPLLADLDFQFRIHSRVQAIRDFDLRMTGGAV